MNIIDEIKAGRKDLTGVDLRGADLYSADFRNADLTGADLRCAKLYDTDFRNADLTGADLRCANLCNADFRNADLSGVDLRCANLYSADLRDTDLTGADLTGTDLIVFQAKLWTAYIQKDVITIGCQRHPVKEWMEFTDEEIHKMHKDALNYWKQYKAAIFSIHATLEN